MVSNNDKFLLHSHVIMVTFDEDIAVFQPYNKAILALEAKELKSLVDTGIKNGITRFIFNLSAAEYISSEALGAVASCWNQCQEKQQGCMAVVLSANESNEVRNLFEIIGLARMIGSAIKTDLKDAINYIKNFS